MLKTPACNAKLFTSFVWPLHEGLVTEMAKKEGHEQTANFKLNEAIPALLCYKISSQSAARGASQPSFSCGLTRRCGKSIWERELGKRKTVFSGTVVANMVRQLNVFNEELHANT